MVFRLPTHLESFLPPPSQQVPQSKPWRGTLVVNLRTIDKSITKELRATAVETDGDNRAELWPTHLYAHPTYDRAILNEVQAWVARHAPPLCTFMPDRLRDADETAANQTAFRSFTRMLFESQMVAIAPWNAPDRLPGGGIIFYPAQNSTALLIGVVFLSSRFPDFVGATPSPYLSHTITSQPQVYASHPGAHTAYGAVTPRSGNTASQPQPGASTSAYTLAHPTMLGQSTDEMKPEGYRYVMSQPAQYQNSTQVIPPSEHFRWPVKTEEEGGVAAYGTTHRIGQSSDHGQGARYIM